MTDHRPRLASTLGFLAMWTLAGSVMAASGTVPSAGETITQSLAYDARDLRVRAAGGYDMIDLKGCASTDRIGEPQLPVDIVRVVLPPGTDVAACTLLEAETRSLPGEYAVGPVQRQRILSDVTGNMRSSPPVEPVASVYASGDPYPAQVATYVSTGTMGGLAVASFAVHPLRYVPKEKRLVFHPAIRFRITLAPSARSVAPPRGASSVEAAAKLLANREDLEAILAESSDARRLKGGAGEVEEYAYVIVTDEAFVPAFQPLADWKTRKGVPARIVTTSWIYAEFPGVDEAEKIRAFIRYARDAWGTTWVLLGGDVARIPTRFAYAMDCAAGFELDENDIPCDLYYSDLDGTWNAGGDPDVYGEVADDVDLYPDVYVGRAPANTAAQAGAFADKVLTYEKNPPDEYLLNMLFAAEVLWSKPFTDQGIAKDRIGADFVPPRYDITRLYQSAGNEGRESVLAAMERGTSIINHDGHAWYSVMCVGDGDLSRQDMDLLRNAPRYSILYSIGCWQAAFDRDSIAEHFVLNPEGGGVACIGNSRYGWGAMGDPGYGYSDRFDREFYRCLFERDIHNIGATLALSKAAFVPFSRQENVYRWCQYQVNLLGDPEMPIWTDAPRSLVVRHPAALPAGPGTIAVSVIDGAGRGPVPDARVCVAKEGEVYVHGLTDALGRVELAVAPASPAGELAVTVTAHNYYPYEATIDVSSEDAYLADAGYVIDDGDGNGDGRLTPGESVKLNVRLRNLGARGVEGVQAVLESVTAGVSVTAGSAWYGDIAAGQSALAAEPFSLVIGDGFTDGDVVLFPLTAFDSGGGEWEGVLSLEVATPRPTCRYVSADDRASGDGDGIPEPGETVTIYVAVENAGSAPLEYGSAALATADPYLTLGEASLGSRTLSAGSARVESFEMTVSGACPSPHFPAVAVEITPAGGPAFAEDLELTIGPTGFFDDMEAGDEDWSSQGANNLWHLSTHRSHSGATSWYCGIEGTHLYPMNNESILVSPPFHVGRNPALSFRAWYDVAVYGVNGFHVEVGDGATWTKLDFIGSGGALNPLLMGNDWLEYTYDLSASPPGTLLQVRFRFVSDGEEVEEGVYIDDVAVTPRGGAIETPFTRSDPNADGRMDLGDPVFVLNYLFASGAAPTCLRAADCNDDGAIDLGDPIALLGTIFAGGPPPPPPYLECGPDPTPDDLSCESFGQCR
ncbi:MAG: hypothetical protein JXP34_20550 [Planctomycetes bacterium]|nr:hypothetical protein [Planctomycetota bacterium]